MSETGDALQDGGWHRLHWTSLFFQLISNLRRYLLPAIVLVVVGGGESWEKYIAILLVPVMIFELVSYFTLRYRLTSDGLTISRRFISKNERHIPYGRVQNVDLIQNVLHRMLGVADVKIETAGGTEPEATLRVLSLEAVEHLRGCVTRGRDRYAPAAASVDEQVEAAGDGEGRVIYRAPRMELVRLGMIRNRGLVIVGILMGLAYQFKILDSDRFEEWGKSFASLSKLWEDVSPFIGVLVGVFIAIAMLALLQLVSVILTIYKLDGFTLRRRGEDLRVSCGLATKLSATVPRHRVQLITIHESWFHRLFDRVTVRIDTAGGAGGNNESEASLSKRWFIPIARREEVTRILEEAGLSVGFDDAAWVSPDDRARRRMIRKSLVVAALYSLLGLIFWRPWGPAIFVLFGPMAVLHALSHARFMGHARTPNAIVFRSGVVVRRTSSALVSKVQSVAVDASPFDRRYDMANLDVDTAGAGMAGHRIRIPYVDRRRAESLASDIAQDAERAGFVW